MVFDDIGSNSTIKIAMETWQNLDFENMIWMDYQKKVVIQAKCLDMSLNCILAKLT